jgi:protein-L-isoaspartate(D-aspartate) O-methyltransferase
MPISAIDRLVAEVARQVRDPRVLRALREVPRDRFVPPEGRPWAYEDRALGIGHEQTISQPTIVGMMTEAAHLGGDERVLEIGTGSGYQAAVLARLAREVVSVEVVDELRERAAALLEELGIDNVTVLPAGDELGAPERGPYDAILVTAAAPEIPPPLIDQLALGGRIVIPVGRRHDQELIVATKTEHGLERESLGGCRFVPLVGRYGFVE